MRDIIFRGIRVDGKGWVEGCLIQTENQAIIVPSDSFLYTKKESEEDLMIMGYIEVKPETVGQSTGLKDKNGKMIFQGDVLECRGVRYDLINEHGKACELRESGKTAVYWLFKENQRMTVIGSIHDKQGELWGH